LKGSNPKENTRGRDEEFWGALCSTCWRMKKKKIQGKEMGGQNDWWDPLGDSRHGVTDKYKACPTNPGSKPWGKKKRDVILNRQRGGSDIWGH